MGEKASSDRRHNRRMARLPKVLDVSREHFHRRRHPKAAPNRNLKIHDRRQILEGPNAQNLETPDCPRLLQQRGPPEKIPKLQQSPRRHPKMPRKLPRKKAIRLPEVLLPLKRRAFGNSLPNQEPPRGTTAFK